MNNNQYISTYPVGNQGYNPTPPKEVMTVDVVNGEQAMYAYYVPPGVTTVLLDFSNSVMYIKATDFSGVPKNTLVYDLHERVRQQPQQLQSTGINDLQTQIDELKQMIAGLTQAQQNRPSNNNQKKGGNQ